MDKTSGNVEFELILQADIAEGIKVILEKVKDPEAFEPYAVRTVFNKARLNGTYTNNYKDALRFYLAEIVKELTLVIQEHKTLV